MGEMHKTSYEYCKDCKYVTKHEGIITHSCEYILHTYKRRGCPVGWYDKKEVGRTKKKWTNIPTR